MSPTTLPAPRAIGTLASELCHANQDMFSSSTWDHPYLMEGFERAVSVCALELLVERDAFPHVEALAQFGAYECANALLEGALAWGTHHGGITAATARELGVTDTELTDVQAAWWWRALGRWKPRYRWNGVAFFPEYALFGTLLLVSERDIERPYARAFVGEHPRTRRIDAVREITPSWLWRLYYGGG